MHSRLTNPLILVIAAVVICIGLIVLWPHSIEVALRNASGGPLRNVRLSVVGGTAHCPKLDDGGSFECRLRATGESNLDVTYETDDGRPLGTTIPIYLDPGDFGRITIIIGSNGKVQYVDGVESWPAGPFG